MKELARPEQGMEIYPVAYGHEHETAHLVKIGDQPASEQEHIARYCEAYIPDQYAQRNHFTVNGFKIYRGGDKCVEVATPECKTPDELIAYTRAGRIIFSEMFELFLRMQSREQLGVTFDGRIQDRVIDGHGNRKASHLNVGIVNSESLPIDPYTVMMHQASRSFVSGAGYVYRNGYRYSQKVNGLTHTNGYGFYGSMYRTDYYHGFRFEDRCGDINLSDWAAWQRIGGMAIAIAISRTPLRNELPDINPNGEIEYDVAKLLNGCPINERGTLKHHDGQFASVDFQQKMAELAMDKLIFYSDELPQELFLVARSLYDYCDEYRAFLSGNISIEEFHAQADWLVKLKIILRDIEKDDVFGIRRSLNDMRSRQIDLMYDSSLFTASDGRATMTKKPMADRLYRKGILLPRVSDSQVQLALHKAPTTTRATLRERLLSTYDVKHIDWHRVTVEDGVRSHEISILDVTQTEFDSLTKEKLSELQPKP